MWYSYPHHTYKVNFNGYVRQKKFDDPLGFKAAAFSRAFIVEDSWPTKKRDDDYDENPETGTPGNFRRWLCEVAGEPIVSPTEHIAPPHCECMRQRWVDDAWEIEQDGIFCDMNADL